jgi:hypothetical protein
MKRAVLSLFALTMLVGSALPAHAIPPILRPGTRPMWASGAFGPAIKLSDSLGQFKLTQTFGYHFSGTAKGPAVAIDLQESFGSHFTTFELVPNFVWDIAIIDGLGLYLSPSAGLGFVHTGASGYSGQNGVTLQFGFAAKLILGDRGMVFFRPINIDILMGDAGVGAGWHTGARWDMLWGGGVIF